MIPMPARYYAIVRGAGDPGCGLTDAQRRLLGRIGPVGGVFCLRDLREHASHPASVGAINADFSPNVTN